MKLKYCTLLLIFFQSIDALAQNYLMHTGTITTCSGNFYDDGGSSGNYSNNTNDTLVINPQVAGNKLTLQFTGNTDIEFYWDRLYIFDGSSVSAALIYDSRWDHQNVGTIAATNPAGSLTVVFKTDGSVTGNGWQAAISCYNPATTPLCPSLKSPATFSILPKYLADKLSWQPAVGALSYNVFYGTSASPPLVSAGQTATMYDISSASFPSNYYYNIIPVNIAGSNLSCPVDSFRIEKYCRPQYVTGTSSGYFIDGVELGSISNISTGSIGGPSYTDYSATMSTVVQPCSLSIMQITSGSSGGYYYIYIDFNDNGIFESFELIGQSYILPSNSELVPIYIPDWSSPGAKRMRIVCADYPSACGANIGETEDYQVVISPGTSAMPSARVFSSAFLDCSAFRNIDLAVGSCPYKICQNDTIHFFDNSCNIPVSWSWYFPGGSPSTSAAENPSVYYATPGYYDVALKVTNSFGSDSIYLNSQVYVESRPAITLGADTFICPGSGIVLQAGTDEPCYSYLWSTGSTTNTIQVTQPGSYWVQKQWCEDFCPGYDTILVSLRTASAGGPYQSLCVSANAFPLQGIPAGGIFSGPGVAAGLFNPQVAGSGMHTIYYSYDFGNGCIMIDSTAIQVYALPSLNFSQSYGPYCISGPPVTLTASPSGGLFSGPGVVGSDFDPSIAGAGTHIISYVYTDQNSCTNSIQTSIEVRSLPVVNPGGPYGPLCISGSAISLIGTPSGGFFSGNGVSGNSFDPASAGIGSHLIGYQFTDSIGCESSASTTIEVLALPVVSAGGPYPPVCENDNSLALSGNPSGGIFSGTGVAGNSFDPVLSGPGTFSIIYAYTDTFSCSNSDTTQITVNPLPVVSTGGPYGPLCENDSSIILTGIPAGGFFTGAGITDSIFDPFTSGTGPITIIYSYTDLNGCSNLALDFIQVNPVPVTPYITIAMNYDTLYANSPNTTWQWYYNGTLLPGETDSMLLNPVATGAYSVQVTNQYNCSVFSQPVLNVSVFDNKPADIVLYPNPVSNELTIQNRGSKTIFVELMNTIGQPVQTVFELREGESQQINVTGLYAGLYFVKLIYDNASRPVPVIIVR